MVASSSIALRIFVTSTSTTHSTTRFFSPPLPFGFSYVFHQKGYYFLNKRLYKFMHSFLLFFFQQPIINISDCYWTRTHNHLVCKQTLNHLAKLADLAKWLSVRLRTKRLWVPVQLQSLKLQISSLLRARSSLTFRQVWIHSETRT